MSATDPSRNSSHPEGGPSEGDDESSVINSTGTTTSTSTSGEEEHGNDLSGEAAGVVRGVSRSILRAANPAIGRLPQHAGKTIGQQAGRTLGQQAGRSVGQQVGRSVGQHAGKTVGQQAGRSVGQQVGRSVGRQAGRSVGRQAGRSVGRQAAGRSVGQQTGRGVFRQRLPLKRVARVSDRMSTGLDWWNTAVESNDASQQSNKWVRIRAFGVNLLRNTLLGLAVFESYGYVVGYFTPSVLLEGENNKDEELPTIDRHLLLEDDENDDDDVVVLDDEPDEYARATLPVHFGAGGIAGSVHGIASTLMEGQSFNNFPRLGAMNIIHHALAHSLLFGTYESIKRGIIQQVHSMDAQYYGGEYLTTFAIAGGIAGQVQFAVSHYTEQYLGLSDFSLRLRPTAVAPSLRPFLWAFPPSAIGFVAFEYGKKFTT